MKKLLEAAGRTAVLAGGAIFATYVAGILEAPNLDAAFALSLTALGAAIAGALAALKEFVPQFSWATILGKWLSPPWISRLDVFTWTAVGALIVSFTDLLNAAPDLSTWPGLVVAAITGALAAGFRTVVGAGTKGESPAPGTGLGDGTAPA